MGNKPDIITKWDKWCAIRFFDAPKGEMRSISGVEEAGRIEGVEELFLTKKAGERMGEIFSSIDRPGYVIAQGGSARKAVEVCESVLSLVKFETR